MKVEIAGRAVVQSQRLDLSYETITLENGLVISVAPLRGSRAVYAACSVPFGSVDRSFRDSCGAKIDFPAGTAHFLEHKMFENRDGDAFVKYADTGASANAYTGFNRTCYVFSAARNIRQSLDIFLSSLFTPYFTEASVRKEQGIIAQEIGMYEDAPDWRILLSLFRCLYSRCPVREDIAGSVASISEITPELLYRCADAFYRPGCMSLALSGRITAEQVLTALRRVSLQKSSAGAVRRITPAEPEAIRSSSCRKAMGISMPLFGLGYKIRPWSRRDRTRREIIASILCELLCGDTTELYRRLYDRGLVNGGLSSEVFSGNGYACIVFYGESRDPDTVLRELRGGVEVLLREGIRQEDFSLCRNMLYGEAAGSLENGEEIAGDLAECGLTGESLFAESEILRSLTAGDVQREMNMMLRPEFSSEAVLLPDKNGFRDPALTQGG